MNKEWFIEAHEVLDSYVALENIAGRLDSSLYEAPKRTSTIQLSLSYEDAYTLHEYIKQTGIFSESQM